jgi:hypothetical protein
MSPQERERLEELAAATKEHEDKQKKPTFAS